MAKAEVAIWHPTLSAAEIERKAGGPARIALSVGVPRRPGTGIYGETYCRFDLGKMSRTKGPGDLVAFERFRSLVSAEEFNVPAASWVAYFEAEANEAEIYLGKDALNYLSQMGFGVVFRGS